MCGASRKSLACLAPKPTMMSRPAWVGSVLLAKMSRILVLFAVGLMLVGCSHGTPITVINQSDAPLEDVVQTGLEVDAFATCATSAHYDNAIRSDILEGQSIGITGTPSFVLGVTTTSGVDGSVVVGAMPYAVFDSTLNNSLRASGTEK
jgi:hypothetical protein